MVFKYSIWSILFLVIGLFISNSCQKEVFSTDISSQPTFSTDTVQFDTVFSTIGSATLIFKIYNPHKEFLKISKAYIGTGQKTPFRMNIDGNPGQSLRDIEIRPHDSVYVFCEVTINPNDPLEVSPFIITDSIVFETNGAKQMVILEARGQNANYFPEKLNKGQASIIDLQGQTLVWNDPKPYIIYGIVYFDHGSLSIKAGTRIHVFGGITKGSDSQGNTFFYNDGRIFIGSDANIQIEGTHEKPVIIQGVRLEPEYQEVSGQWSGIVIDKFSQGNTINYTTIKNNQIGLYVDSAAQCKISNTIFANNSVGGLYGYAAEITMNNSLFYNQGQASFSAINGGKYDFTYCTFANLGNSYSGIVWSNFYCEDPIDCPHPYTFPLDAKMTNCIITGSDDDELSLKPVADPTVRFNLLFDHCLLKIRKLTDQNQFPKFIQDYTQNCIISGSLDPLFIDISKDNYRLDTLSIADGKGIPINNIFNDLENVLRDPVKPDLGCYERLK